MIPNSLNIRKALELEVPVTEIFRIDVSPQGNDIAMRAYEDGLEKFIKKNGDSEISPVASDGAMYSTAKTKHRVNDLLDAYVYDSYLIYPDKDNGNLLSTDKTTEIEFLSTKILDINEFCKNVMDAQAFSGLHEKNIFKYSFIGTGSFSMADYSELHVMASQSRMHFIDFFIFHKNILSSISFFISGLCENDINSQKEYLTEDELKERIKEARRQKKLVSEITDRGDGS
jgi:hypothetical protein